ncbi:MAG: hypothetical protein V4555_17250 [Acidobacteriota bacterium]
MRGQAQWASGFAMLGDHRALVWSEGVANFQLWQVALGDESRWMAVGLPPELVVFAGQKREVDDRPYVTVEASDGVVRLLWVSHGNCEKKRWAMYASLDVAVHDRADQMSCGYELVQATAVAGELRGKVEWKVARSELTDALGREIVRVKMMEMVTPSRGWMLLEGDSVMNSMPEVLLTTVDGGTHWIKKAAWGLPIGTDFVQVLLPVSDTEAWMALTLPSRQRVSMWHTVSGGNDWVRNPTFAQKAPWCPECVEGRYWRWPDADGRICVGVSYYPPNEHSGAVDAPAMGGSVGRVCREKVATAWSVPVKMEEPGGAAAAPEAAEEMLSENGFGLAVVSERGSYRSALWMSADDGVSWRKAPGSLRGEDVWVEEMDADKADVLVLLKSSKDGVGRLMYSGSDGARWVELAVPAGK